MMPAQCLCNELPAEVRRGAEDVIRDVLGFFPLVDAFELLAPAEPGSPWFVRLRLGGLWMAGVVAEDEKTAEGVRAATLSLLVPSRDERRGGSGGLAEGRRWVLFDRG